MRAMYCVYFFDIHYYIVLGSASEKDLLFLSIVWLEGYGGSCGGARCRGDDSGIWSSIWHGYMRLVAAPHQPTRCSGTGGCSQNYPVCLLGLKTTVAVSLSIFSSISWSASCSAVQVAADAVDCGVEQSVDIRRRIRRKYMRIAFSTFYVYGRRDVPVWYRRTTTTTETIGVRVV
jgi:hypothetical protein